MPAGRSRDDLEGWFATPEGPQTLFAGRVLSFDEKAALIWSRLMAEDRLAGRPCNGLDMIIAAVAEANDCIVVTDDNRHFDCTPFLNPVRGAKGMFR